MVAAARPTKIGLLIGADDHAGLLPSEVNFLTVGCTDIHMLRDRALDGWWRIQIPPNYARQHQKPNFKAYDVLLNLVTDADQHNRVLSVMAKALKDYRGRLLNPPAAIVKTSRDQIARRLGGIENLTVPRVARFAGTERFARLAIERAGVVYPAIMRTVGTHGGEIIGIVQSTAEVVSKLHPKDEYFLTEFVETCSADGLYRKMRVFFIGGTPVIRHWLTSDDWCVHAKARTRFMLPRPALIEQERELIEGGVEALPQKAQAVLTAISEKMKLDFFGADLALAPDGSLTLFEANATMNFFPLSTEPPFAYLAIARDRAAQAYGRLLHPNGVPESLGAL